MTKKNRLRRTPSAPSPFEQARDELFQQIMRCDVIGADPEHQAEWFAETVKYFGERYPELAQGDLKDLRTLGERFVQPPKAPTPVEESVDAVATEQTDAVVAEVSADEATVDDAAAVAALVDESATVSA
jgi:hypothetical protein